MSISSYLVSEYVNEMAQNAMLTSKRDYSLESIYRSWEKAFDKLAQ